MNLEKPDRGLSAGLVIASKAKIEMPANSLLQKFLAPFVILLSGGLLAFSWWIEYSLEKYVEQTVEEDLIGRFELLAISTSTTCGIR